MAYFLLLKSKVAEWQFHKQQIKEMNVGMHSNDLIFSSEVPTIQPNYKLQNP